LHFELCTLYFVLGARQIRGRHLQQSAQPGGQLRLSLKHRQRRIVGSARSLHPAQQVVENRFARSVLDAGGARLERIFDIARRSGRDGERQVLCARLVADTEELLGGYVDESSLVRVPIRATLLAARKG